MPSFECSIENPRDDDVRALVARHLAFARAHTPPAGVHALDSASLEDPSVTLFGVRESGCLLALGGLREVDAGHGEIKSMHTAAEARGRGIAERLTRHLVAEARRRGWRRLSLETGVMEAFEPARALYAKVGFEPCGPFGSYAAGPTSAFMTLKLAP